MRRWLLGWPQGQGEEQAVGRERALQRALVHREEEEGLVRPVARATGQEDHQVVANRAGGARHPTSWISFLCADPTDSPRPKGWETTLEPYRTLVLKFTGCPFVHPASHHRRPALQDQEGRAGFVDLNSLAGGAFQPTVTELGNGIINQPFDLDRVIKPEHKGFV